MKIMTKYFIYQQKQQGLYYDLFNIYENKFPLNENYKIKLFFYELFTEIMCYYDANIDIKIKISEFEAEAKNLETEMINYGIKL